MKNAILAILALGLGELVSAAPMPAGGFYPSPGIPPFSGFGGGGTPWSGRGLQMCNCNNPATKETMVEPFCTQSGGKDEYRVFAGVEPIKQHMITRPSILHPKPGAE
ncbi:hypothetical protein B0T14DRAFT_566351 [Immersiella caudata]|uniref:Uncharacterized protein n=1 Tax=Immersiella caudata TaxID=314043 RepID=A0AA40BZH2_9PEZI|nr:hypothetical protein B0T14DRAFT_566351 [Immersiella caudata]